MADVRRFSLVAVLLVGACMPGPRESPTPSARSATTGANQTASPEPTAGATFTPVPIRPATGRIAFIRSETVDGVNRTDAYAIDADGSNLSPLTDDDLVESGLFWLNDGSRLVMLWERADNPYRQYLSSVLPDGSDRIELGGVQTYGQPRTSPDGRYVAFGGDGAEDQEPPTGVMLLDLETGAHRQLTTDGATDPMWSPDGTRIVAILPSRRLEVIDMASGDITARIEGEIPHLIGWSEDGATIRYEGCPSGQPRCGEYVPYEANADGSNARRYEPRDGDVLPGVVSPDGSWLATLSLGCTLTAVAVGDADTVPAMEWRLQLDACEDALGGLHWSPIVSWHRDSQWFVSSQGKAGASVLVRSSIAGGQPVPLTDGASDFWPAWRP